MPGIHRSTQRLSDRPVNIKSRESNYNAARGYDCCVMSEPRLHVRASFIWCHSTTLHYQRTVLLQSITEFCYPEFLSIFNRLQPIRLLWCKPFLEPSLIALNAKSFAHCHYFTFSAYLMADQSETLLSLGANSLVIFERYCIFFFLICVILSVPSAERDH